MNAGHGYDRPSDVREESRLERDWLRLAETVGTKAEMRYCLAQALSINNGNAGVRRALESLGTGSVCPPSFTVEGPRTFGAGRRLGIRAAIRDYPIPILVFYLLAITLTEFLTLVIDPRIGLWGHSALLVVLTVHAALIWRRPFYKLVLTLAFAPLIRIVSLVMPLAQFPLIYWYLLTSLPLFVTAFMVVYVIDFKGWQIGLMPGNLAIQFLVGLSGLALGYIEYRLLRPEAMFATFDWGQMVVPALILLISTGFVEELIFRGIMQRAAEECLGRELGWVYVAAIFAMMHMGHSSWLDILFVFGVSMLFSWAVSRTRSLLGVTLAHGLTNILLFLVMPVLGG